MITQKNSVQETHYDVLHVKEDATYEVIRASYRSSVLNFHPDKVHNTLETPSAEYEQGDRFLKVQGAWEVLSNPRSRALYDIQLQCSRDDAVVADDVSIQDVVAEVTGEVSEFHYLCSCGDCFSISSSELEEMGYQFSTHGDEICVHCSDCLPGSVILYCGSCSLKIRLLVPSDARIPIHDPNDRTKG